MPVPHGPDAGVLPFLIDWASSPHPSGSLPHAVGLLELRIEHPDPARVLAILSALGEADSTAIMAGPVPRLTATLATPAGLVPLV